MAARESGSGAIRAFLGLELGAAARGRAAALAEALRRGPGGDGVRWVREESLHVTLRFLGATDPAVLPEITRRVAVQTRALAPFALRLGEPGAFPSPRRPRVIVLGLEPPEPVVALAEAVERGVVDAGLPPEERPFRPHVTLGRVRERRRAALALDVTAPVTGLDEAWDVTETVLFQSETLRSGARYTALQRIPLGSRDGPSTPPRVPDPRGPDLEDPDPRDPDPRDPEKHHP